ncbi:MAG: MATE family efflux transporter [Candidatus Omnitrophica bacterium]|nr:MATE family efflux transporter [Candidatus Omnitrophota bacterium]
MPKKIKSLPKPGGIMEMLAVALPMLVSMTCDTIMIFTDRLFLSKLEPEMMNASMGGGLTVFMMMSFFVGLTGYSTALVAQYLGAGQKKNCPMVISQAVIVSCAAYLPILFCRPLAHQMFRLMGVSSQQLFYQNVYFDILLYGAIITLLRNSLSCFFSGIGRTRIVMIASFTAMLVNAILNYILIFGKLGLPAMGIRGAALGTLMGGASGFFILVFAYFSKNNSAEFDLAHSFKFDFSIMKKLLRFGSSPGLELFLNILAFNAMVMVFHAQGLVTATASTIMFNWDMVSFVPLLGIEIAVTSMVGRYMGARNPYIANQSAMSGLKVGLVFSTIILILFVGFPHLLINVFRPAGSNVIFIKSIPMALYMIRVASLYIMVEALFIVFIGALRGAGDTFWAMCISVTLHWAMVLVVAVALKVFKQTPEAAWTYMVVIFIGFSFIVYWRYRIGHWRNIKVVEIEPVPIISNGFHGTIDL